MQSSERAKPPVGIIFDSDLGNSIDDMLALAILYGLDVKGEARVVAISLTTSSLKTAAFCDAVANFYAGGPGLRRGLPIGLAADGRISGESPMVTVPLAKTDASGKPVYAYSIHKLTDTAEVAPLIRNAFTAQHDQNAIAILAGPATNLAKVLDLSGAKEIIARKVRFLCMMGGAFPDGAPEFNVKSDIAAARKVLAEWPTPIVASGYEVGESLLYPGASIEKDFNWTPNHPIADAYRAYRKMPYDAPTWDATAVLYAVRPHAGYFKVSEPGTITVLDDGRTRFTPSPEGRHRYLILDPSQKERILSDYVALASAKPVPRLPRFLQQQQQQQRQADPPKPPAPKLPGTTK